MTQLQELRMQTTSKYRLIRLGGAKRLTKGDIMGAKELTGPGRQQGGWDGPTPALGPASASLSALTGVST
jgi:hypothetical protein